MTTAAAVLPRTLAPWSSKTLALSKIEAATMVEPSTRAGKAKDHSEGIKRLKVAVPPTSELAEKPLQANELLGIVDRAIRGVLDGSFFPPLPAIWAACQKLIMLHNKGKDLADKVKMALERRCGELHKDYKSEDHDPVNWTAIFIAKWGVFFTEKVPILCSMLAYLDRGYLLPPNLPSIKYV